MPHPEQSSEHSDIWYSKRETCPWRGPGHSVRGSWYRGAWICRSKSSPCETTICHRAESAGRLPDQKTGDECDGLLPRRSDHLPKREWHKRSGNIPPTWEFYSHDGSVVDGTTFRFPGFLKPTTERPPKRELARKRRRVPGPLPRERPP